MTAVAPADAALGAAAGAAGAALGVSALVNFALMSASSTTTSYFAPFTVITYFFIIYPFYLKIKQSTYSNYYLSGIYFVTDESVTQNRTFTGTLNIKNGFAYFNLEITKYGKNTEIIHKEEVLTNFGLSRILRLTTDLTEKEIYSKEILKEEYDKYNNFEKNAIKCLKKGNWNE